MRDVFLCLAIAAIAAAVNRGVLSCGFVNYDDPTYVSENARVQQGLSLSNIGWAFTFVFSSWTPLDTLSHMADCQLFGLNPRGHHATNLALHAANAALLFLLLSRLTGSPWKSALAATLFAVHPINSGAVAWISSRKDLLSTFFGLLALAAYAGYARRPNPWRYVPLILFFVLGLMAKPMLIVLPAICLVLDVWPLHRISFDAPAGDSARAVPPLLLEKLPLFTISAGFSVLAYFTQRDSGSIMSSDWYPLPVRVENALVSTVTYLCKAVWPAHFTVAYPHLGSSIPLWQVIGSAALVLAATAAALLTLRKYGFYFAGWFWYLVALLPVSGLVSQLGGSSMADRYVYFSMMGIFVAVVWGVASLESLRAWLPKAGAGVAVVLLVVFAQLTHSEHRHWRDAESLWAHALDVTKSNAIAHGSYGEALMKSGKLDLAAVQLKEAIRIMPQMYTAQNWLGTILAMQGDLKGAEERFREALRVKPDHATAMCNLAKCRLDEKDYTQAKGLFEEALKHMPGYDPNRPVVERVLAELSTMDASSAAVAK